VLYIYHRNKTFGLWEEEEEEGEPAVDFATIYGTQVLFWPGCAGWRHPKHHFRANNDFRVSFFFSKISDLAEKWS
jgi:hypothetical protein